MKRVRAICLLILAVILGGCGTATLHSTTSLTFHPAGNGPPAWLQEEAAWQALAAGDAQPVRCRWTLTSLTRAATLGGASAAFLRLLGAHTTQRVYVVVLTGRFETGAGGAVAPTLYLVLRPDHYYLEQGLATERLALSQLGRLRSFTLQPPVGSGVWGHTLFEGGPAPGGPSAQSHVAVGVWTGSHASGSPLHRLRSDGDGFFAAKLPPGTYTFKLLTGDLGFPAPTTATVAPGRLMVVGVYSQAP